MLGADEQITRSRAGQQVPLSQRRLAGAGRVASEGRWTGNGISMAATRALRVIVPPMIDDPRLPFKIIQVTCGMFRQFVVDRGYKIEGHNANKLIALLADSNMINQPVTHISDLDATAFVAWRHETTGKDWRLLTDQQWNEANATISSRLTRNLWDWTRTVANGFTMGIRTSDGWDIFLSRGYRSNVATLRLAEKKVNFQNNFNPYFVDDSGDPPWREAD